MCDNHDEIPVKDVTEAHRTKSLVLEKERGIRRDEIHDRMLQLADENVFLKKHARRFEEKAKHLEAKLNRILSEKKFATRKDEIDAEESKHRIIELEYQVGMLKDRLQVAKQQLASYTQLFPVHAKQKPKSTKAQGSNSTTTTTATGCAESAVPNSELAEQFELILLEAKTENQALENQVKNLRDQILSLERELGTAKELLQIKEVAYEDEVNILRAQISDADQTKRKLADNIKLIRVQRDSRRACSWVSTLETQCKALEASLSSAQDNTQQLETQLNAAQEELRECQQQKLNLHKQVEDSLAEISRVKELEAQISSFQEENAILKDTTESLQAKLKAAGDKVREVETEETSLKTQISNMELTLKKEIQSKTDLYSEVSRETNRTQTLNETLQELQKKFSAMELELKRMEKVSLASVTYNSSEVLRGPPAKEKEVVSEVIVATPNNVLPAQTVQESETQVETATNEKAGSGSPCQYCQSLEKNLAETRSTMDRLHDDFIKTKNLLKNQMSTNRECHKEIEVLSLKLEKADKFHHEKLQGFMEVLEERAKQMQALEKSLEVIKSQSRLNIAFTDAEVQVEQSGSKNGDSESFTEQSEAASQLVVTAVSSVIAETHSPSSSPESRPSLDVFIDKFIPNEDSKELTAVNLFATWELNEATKYTPIVSGGVFNSSSTHLISCEMLKVPLPIHIHQAIGESDCKAIGHGYLHPDATICTVKSVDESQKKIGNLQYKLKVQGLHLKTEPTPEAGISFEKTNSISGVPAQPVPQVECFPKPKPRRLPSEADMEAYSSLTETSEKEDRGSRRPGSSKTKRKKADAVKYLKKYLSPKREKSVSFEKSPSPKKPILRRDSASPEVKKKLVKRVTVTEVVEERRIPSSDEDKSEKMSSVSEKTLAISESSSETSRDESQLKSSIGEAGAPKIMVQSIDVKQALVTSVRVNAESATTTTEQEQSSGSGNETSPICRADISKARKKRSRKSGESSASSLELSENDSSSQDSQTYKHSVRIEIAYIVFNSPSRIWGDPNVKKIFIEYRFLDFDPEELETPNSIPKPQPGKKGEFNFVKVFQIDTKERRRLLQTMLEEKKRIRFTLVSEPGENDTLDCEDLGYAYVPIVSLMKEDLVQESIPVYDAENPRSEMGSICVSIQARQALKSL